MERVIFDTMSLVQPHKVKWPMNGGSNNNNNSNIYYYSNNNYNYYYYYYKEAEAETNQVCFILLSWNRNTPTENMSNLRLLEL